MNTDPRSALAALIAALERHYEAAASSRGDDDPALEAATEGLTTAFDAYDDALFDAYDVATPLIVFDGDDEDDDYEDDDDYDDLDDDDLDDDGFEDDEDGEEGPDGEGEFDGAQDLER
ncbi:DNA primase [Brachybacterium halotolerans subsp. kimchii]|uniref:DNA primase n=1 Tax=Brachybacterium halotolerans TaxID=2795215 RepID=A0ABS1B609_9MICO|nr:MULTISPECIES: DNA primase [Brachybacterium]MBK0330066.1 DNA primase [Brachybacterium halotolerans]MCG7309113.1 DNA primase [Brachybacterium sp. ACRRE]UEJ83154.1 DNA primase [Brachybacterium halotolerans subsp. kimchii]